MAAVATPAWIALAAADRGAEAARIAAVTRPTDRFDTAEPFELRPAGAATVSAPLTRDAFSLASANMSFERELQFKVGNGLFRKDWVSAPSSTTASDGLGPLFNSRACQACHLKDGRGHPPEPGEAAVSMFLRLSVPSQTEADRAALAARRVAVIGEPTYGTQLQAFSIQGYSAEGSMGIRYEEVPMTLADGTVVSVRKPAYWIEKPAYGPPHPDIMLSPRIAPPMIGMGLLEAIDEKDILSRADPEDRDGDGISGRPNTVWSASEQRVTLGRFGWKAGKANVADQSAAAFRGDLGLSTPLHPEPSGDCTTVQSDCLSAPHGGGGRDDTVEVTQQMLDLVVFYSRNLGVPARRDVDDPQVLAGKRQFYAAGCPACHTPKYVTQRLPDRPEQSFQLIWPYTDMLLHDMGDGLADNRPEGDADGREWRTPPLWGIGLTELVSGHTQFLHDGRARNLLEAILW
ncbi:MAG: di-heme oxidoredictase family protein, partial [Alphaproteobacteria bacterium]